MKRVLLLNLLLIISWTAISAQCTNYFVEENQAFHANSIRTFISTAAELFGGRPYTGQFNVPFTGSGTPSAMYAGSVWIGGMNEQGELKLAAQMFQESPQRLDYLPGPLTESGQPFGCAEWDTIWSVTRYEILEHLEDYQADGVIDDKIQSVFGWPGAQNIFFEEINGFPLPDEAQGYAPFYDTDKDGIYEPERGEFPSYEGYVNGNIPDQITWDVFHDVRDHAHSLGEPLLMEVQQTCYAYYCVVDPIANQSLFLNYKITNMGEALDSVFFGLWLDPDIGCFLDDFVGSWPEQDVFFAYNRDQLDGDSLGDCDDGTRPYRLGPPSLSGIFLNTPLSSFIYFEQTGEDELERPSGPVEHYRLLTGSWKDGTPLTEGGTGYNPGSGFEKRAHAFDGDPNDPSSWAMTNVSIAERDKRILPATQLGRLSNGESRNITIALTLHLDTLVDHLGNVALMYEQVPLVKSLYQSGFVDCIQPGPCLADCVWPGDANNDGIANHLDLLNLGLAHGITGSSRSWPLNWTPHHAKDWTGEFLSGVNLKHADVNGDAKIEMSTDIDLLETHYGLIHDGFQGTLDCGGGTGLNLEGDNPDGMSSRSHLKVRLDPDIIDSLYGIAFSLKYDTAYFWRALAVGNSPFPQFTGEVLTHDDIGQIDFSACRFDGINHVPGDSTVLFTYLYHSDPLPDVPGNDTTRVCVANAIGILKDGTQFPLGGKSFEFVFVEGPSADRNFEVGRQINVYPNPSSGKVCIEVPAEQTGASYEVFNSSGQMVTAGLLETTITHIVLPPGVFMLNVRNAELPMIERVVILD
jgi:hypothetical protein